MRTETLLNPAPYWLLYTLLSPVSLAQEEPAEQTANTEQAADTEQAAQTPPAITPPRLIEEKEATYPEEARQQRIEGTVILLVELDAAGVVVDVETVVALVVAVIFLVAVVVVILFVLFHVGVCVDSPSLQALRAETMVDGLPRAFRWRRRDKQTISRC